MAVVAGGQRSRRRMPRSSAVLGLVPRAVAVLELALGREQERRAGGWN
ncbi:MAG TPA: hypothetical protein VFV73_18830 [Streptosporangiaceae bacterium]|nr:hypothetical protein [Streptosporangiaceae bacterium]